MGQIIPPKLLRLQEVQEHLRCYNPIQPNLFNTNQLGLLNISTWVSKGYHVNSYPHWNSRVYVWFMMRLFSTPRRKKYFNNGKANLNTWKDVCFVDSVQTTLVKVSLSLDLNTGVPFPSNSKSCSVLLVCVLEDHPWKPKSLNVLLSQRVQRVIHF